jgi:hypothetical protein
MAARRLAVLAVGLTVVLAATACGGGGSGKSSAADQQAAAIKTSAAIKARLHKAGYHVVAVPINPNAKPRPTASFKVDTAYPNANQFEFDVYVFRSPSQAATAAKAGVDASSYLGGKVKVVSHGPVMYLGTTATTADLNGDLPVPQFNRTVAIAQGRAASS